MYVFLCVLGHSMHVGKGVGLTFLVVEEGMNLIITVPMTMNLMKPVKAIVH